jgi:hypothetical protein
VRASLLLVVALLAASGCLAPAAPPVSDEFPTDPDAGTGFALNATGGDFALHLDVAHAGRVAYRVLAREGAHVDACLIPGADADLWWANHTVPARACQRDTILARQGATLDAGAWSLVIRAYGCPSACHLAAVVDGATVTGTAQGPPDLARVEARDAAMCPMC